MSLTPASIGSVIATRTLTSQRSGARFLVEIGMPKRVGDHFVCAYRLTGADDTKTQEVCGEDGVQALQVVMSAIGASFGASDEWGWLEPGDIGFPRPGDMKFSPKLVQQIDRATRRVLAARRVSGKKSPRRPSSRQKPTRPRRRRGSRPSRR